MYVPEKHKVVGWGTYPGEKGFSSPEFEAVFRRARSMGANAVVITILGEIKTTHDIATDYRYTGEKYSGGQRYSEFKATRVIAKGDRGGNGILF